MEGRVSANRPRDPERLFDMPMIVKVARILDEFYLPAQMFLKISHRGKESLSASVVEKEDFRLDTGTTVHIPYELPPNPPKHHHRPNLLALFSARHPTIAFCLRSDQKRQ